MDEPTTRAWSKPELIVLVRSRPEEAVLGVCKTSTSYGPAYQDAVCTIVSIGTCDTDEES